MKTAGEGGAWGIALLASYMINKRDNQTLADFLDTEVFKNAEISTLNPDKEDVAGFEKFMESYRAGLAAERAAVESLKVNA